ncbi:MAG TPA: 2,3-bisphosphoglycerate-independent phosphoglycerate mutase, partial [Candidatus Nanoarchaeia archaeon]|nr:2,3-bisphosphoglycerate-independent phosphoglycerate mutase [Candidatus Nanoarchaeia archaeon]
LDGWGYRAQKKGNAIAQAKTPRFDALNRKFPHTLLEASGPAVGLPKGVFGNSEVGHLTIGAGRVIESHQSRIDKAIRNGSFFRNEQLLNAITHVKKRKSTLHVIGLLSDRGVHADDRHLHALLRLCRQKGLKKVIVHPILDGRDTPPKSALKYLRRLHGVMKRTGVGTLGTLMGRYYAMDRDNRWDRTKKAYEVLTLNGGYDCDHCRWPAALNWVRFQYSRRITDEFMPPLTSAEKGISSSDAVVFTNFREDRARQLTHAFVDKNFDHFKRPLLKDMFFCSFTSYDHELHNPVAFPLLKISDTLGEVYARAGLKQLRVAETEKYAHVTYFFNALRKEAFSREDRVLVPSPKVATYDQTPGMSARKITDVALKAIKGLRKNKYSLIVVNFANADMVGHTGDMHATRRAVEIVDGCVGQLVDASLKSGAAAIVTADHGNAELKLAPYETSHTHSPVPLIVCDPALRKRKLRQGGLSQVAPTILAVSSVKKPSGMSSKPLF